MVLIETVVTGFVDEFPSLGLKPCIRLMTTISVCIICFLLGITMTTQAGILNLSLMSEDIEFLLVLDEFCLLSNT